MREIYLKWAMGVGVLYGGSVFIHKVDFKSTDRAIENDLIFVRTVIVVEEGKFANFPY